MGKSILLTGGTGMVGQSILAHPQIRKHDIVAPTRAELDLSDAAAVAKFIAVFEPHLVIHAAGKVGGIQANIAEPTRFLVENLDVGRNVIMGATAAQVPQLLNLASSCVYPESAPNPLREDMILTGEFEPTNEGYALAKVVALRLCEYVSRTNPGLEYKTLIPCNLYGPHDKFGLGHAHLIPALIHRLHEAAASKEATVSMWGDGTARREFLFVNDLADCIAKAVQDFSSMPSLMNVGLGTDYSINDYYQEIAKCVGFEGTFEHDLTKPVGMARKLVDTKLQEQWGWCATTTLEDGLKQTFEFYLQTEEQP